MDALARWAERVLAVALLTGVFLNFANVVGRYFAGFALNGVDEIEIYILIWTTFLGAAVVTWRRQHLRMDVLINACPPMFRKTVALVESLVMLAVFTFVAVQSAEYVGRIYSLGAASDIARIPTWIPHSAITVNFALMALIIVLHFVLDMLSQSRISPEAAGDESRS